MNLTTITKPNSKGQIVIPKKFREELKINENVFLNLILRGNGVFITPFGRSVTTSDSKKISLEVLKKTAGAWRGDDWQKTERDRRKTELSASKKRKTAW